jgi:hypothetical protein
MYLAMSSDLSAEYHEEMGLHPQRWNNLSLSRFEYCGAGPRSLNRQRPNLLTTKTSFIADRRWNNLQNTIVRLQF